VLVCNLWFGACNFKERDKDVPPIDWCTGDFFDQRGQLVIWR